MAERAVVQVVPGEERRVWPRAAGAREVERPALQQAAVDDRPPRTAVPAEDPRAWLGLGLGLGVGLGLG